MCGYSEALMRISERGCIRAAEWKSPAPRLRREKGVAVSSCFCYRTRLNESLPGSSGKGWRREK